MNIVINPANFNNKNIFFSDKKKNNIIDGYFSKIIYSSDCYTMNGLYLIIPFACKTTNNYFHTDEQNCNPVDITNNKYTVYFYAHDTKNLQYITNLSEIESSIVNTYKEMNGLKKCSNLVLTNQLYKGFFKIYKDKHHYKSINETKYLLKISGIWENTNEVGITYKFIEISDNTL